MSYKDETFIGYCEYCGSEVHEKHLIPAYEKEIDDKKKKYKCPTCNRYIDWYTIIPF